MSDTARDIPWLWPGKRLISLRDELLFEQQEQIKKWSTRAKMMSACSRGPATRGRPIKSTQLLMVANTTLVALLILAQASGRLIVNCDPEASMPTTSQASNTSSQAPGQLPPVATSQQQDQAAASTHAEATPTTTTRPNQTPPPTPPPPPPPTTTTTTTTTTTITTDGSSSLSANSEAASGSSTRKTDAEYKQRPMPTAESSSSSLLSSSLRANISELKISYDIVQAGANATGALPIFANQTGVLEPLARVAPQNVATGELLPAMSSLLPAAGVGPHANEEMAEQGEMMATSASSLSELSLTDSPASLDEAGQQQGAPIIMRHGRSDQNAYSPPATSRLSSYEPGFSLQNSRSHNRQSQAGGGSGGGNSIGAVPLQFSSQLAAAATSERAATQTTSSSTTARTPHQGPFDPIIVCYLGSWSTYRPSLAKFTPENINPFLCTHIIYAFAGLSSKFELRPFDSYNDITQGGYKKFTSLKEHNKQLKTLIAVGGWNEGSARFSKLVASAELRANFVASTIRFLREHHFDGLDLDWEYPGYRDGSSPDDRERYALLIKVAGGIHSTSKREQEDGRD